MPKIIKLTTSVKLIVLLQENRNIGDYDTCPNGCKYCYANQNPQIAQENYKKHNPNDLMILGNLKSTDELQQSSQKSFLENNIQQKLF